MFSGFVVKNKLLLFILNSLSSNLFISRKSSNYLGDCSSDDNHRTSPGHVLSPKFAAPEQLHYFEEERIPVDLMRGNGVETRPLLNIIAPGILILPWLGTGFSSSRRSKPHLTEVSTRGIFGKAGLSSKQ